VSATRRAGVNARHALPFEHRGDREGFDWPLSAEHLFVLEQALALYDVYQQKVAACDIRIESVLNELISVRGSKEDASANGSGSPRRRSRQSNGPDFDVGKALNALLGKDLTRIHGIGPYLAFKLVSECGDDLSAWPTAKHFTSWLCLAPSNKYQEARFCRREQDGPEAALRRFCDWPP